MDYYGRNTIWGFRDRVRTNLMYLSAARNQGADVHVVTELITSLLGLIVFPFAEIKRSGSKAFRKYKLDDLSDKGWPDWRVDLGSSPDLDDLILHLRNAISHRLLFFSSDSRELEGVEVRFADRPSKAQPDGWAVTINAAELQKFVLLFADLLKEWEHDYS